MSDADLIPLNFLGLPAETSGYADARVVVVPIGFEATVSYGAGTRGGPEAILAASRQVETYQTDLDVDLAQAPIHTLDPVAPDLTSPGAMTDRIRRVAARLGADGKWVLGLGGEHAVTLGLVRAAHERHGALSILQIDAHLDLRDQFEGTPFSHASVMRRCVEDGNRTVHVGIRNACREEVEFARREGLPIFWGRQCAAGDAWIADAVAALRGPVYLSVDVDGLDPSVIRTTGTPEPGGLGWWTTMGLIEAVFAKHEVVGADVVELVAAGDPASDFAAARLAARLAALALYGQR
ncbi:MAG: agmatinase [Planctomycetes bacterium]|nr:agmatinase [Planctomycetota bacterium]